MPRAFKKVSYAELLSRGPNRA